MALRLSKPAPGPALAPATATIPARATALLAARDLAAYRSLFVEASGEPDFHFRYATRVKLLEAGLGVPRSNTRDTAHAFLATAESGVELLEAEPREPVFLNYTGIALYELGALDGARRLFEAALRLDPEMPNVQRNLREVARRRRAGSQLAKLPAPVLAALKPLEARAKRAAAQAKPVEGLTLSLCMIVRDEEAMIGRSLAAIHEHVDEIIVVDTGSKDRTMEIAREYGATVIEREWTGSFADARNVSFDAATSDWIMYLDADEVLMEGEGERLRALTGRTWREAFYLVETNHTGSLEDGTAVNHDAMRVFRNRPEYRFEGRIHEQIAHRLPGGQPERLERTDVQVEHFGYLGVVREAKQKSNRNLDLLERQAAEGVDTPFLYFNLGSERSARGEHEEALGHFRRAWKAVRADHELLTYGYVPSLAARLAQTLNVTGHREELDRHASDVLTLFPDFTDVVFARAIAARNAGDIDVALELFERCLKMGDAPSRYSPMIGCGSYMASAMVADLYRGRGEPERAEALLRASIADNPRFLGGIEPLAQILLERGLAGHEVVKAIEEAGAEDTPARHFILAVPLYEAGAVEAAEAELRAVLERQPHIAPARAALAEALLSQRRYAEAAQVAAEIAPESPVAAAAARAELFARLAGAEPVAKVDEALERARAAGMAAPERLVFEAWRALAAGEAAPRLPEASAPVVVAMLEALLRVQDVDPFVAALPLAEAVAMPVRVRRELMAQMYLRRGFLESAADEWAAACHEGGPDADALAGLAAVSVAREAFDDAEIFASGAQELQPGHPGAQRVLERLAA